MAGSAEEDEVFEGVEIEPLGNTTALEVVELGNEVSLDYDFGCLRDVQGGGPLY